MEEQERQQTTVHLVSPALHKPYRSLLLYLSIHHSPQQSPAMNGNTGASAVGQSNVLPAEIAAVTKDFPETFREGLLQIMKDYNLNPGDMSALSSLSMVSNADPKEAMDYEEAEWVKNMKAVVGSVVDVLKAAAPFVGPVATIVG